MTRSHLKRGDVLLSIVGTIGELSLVASDGPATCSCKLAILRPRSVSAEYLAVALQSRYGRLQIERLTRGAVQMGLNLDDLDQILVPRLSGNTELRIAQLVTEAKRKRDQSEITLQAAEQRLFTALGLADWSPPDRLTRVCRLSDLATAARWDSQFHLSSVDGYLDRLSRRFELDVIGSFSEVTNGDPVQYAEDGEDGGIPIIRSGDLANIYNGTRLLRAAGGQSVFKLEIGDVLISSIGFGSIGKVQVFDLPGVYGTVSEVTVVRQRRLDPYYLASFLRSKVGQLQIERWITGATGQLHLYPRDVKRILVPMGDPEVQQYMRRSAEEARYSQYQSAELLKTAKRTVEIAIEQDETAALRFLDVAEA